MRKLLLAIICGSVIPAYASTTLELWGNAYRVDTLEHFYIGPGVTHTHLLFSSESRNLDVVVATLDKNDPSYSPVVKPRVEIGRDEAREVERVSEVAVRKSGGDRQYIAAINADFFNMTNDDVPWRGWPVNATVIDRKFATPAGSHRGGVIIGPEGMWIDDAANFAYVVSSPDGANSINAASFNCASRGGNALYVFNDYMQNKVTTSADWDRDLCLVMDEGSEWCVNKPMKFRVSAPWRNGAGEIPVGGIVLTATSGFANEWLDNLAVGDEVNLEVQFSLPGYGNIRPDVTHLVSGDVRFLKDGQTEWAPGAMWYGNLYTQGENYPMSMAGFSQEQDRFVLASISRNGPNNSTGINYPEAADLMRFLGCYNAVNFDGGGSTTMYAAPMGVVSFLQYGTERPVGNGLFLAMDTPADNTVASIRIAEPFVNMSQYATYTPTVYGYNQYGQLVDMAVTDFTVEPSEAFDVRGNAAIADLAGTHALTVTKDGMKASVAVNVAPVAVEATYPAIVLDRVHEVRPALRALVDGYYKDLDINAFEWTSSDPGIFTVDESNRFVAVATGKAVATGRRADTSVDIAVSVEIVNVEPFAPLHPYIGNEDWTLTGDGLENLAVTAVDCGSSAYVLTFDSTRKRGLSATYAADFEMYGLPDSLVMDLNTNGSRLSTIVLNVDAANGLGSFRLSPENAVTEGGHFVFDFAKAFDTANYAYYPLKFRSLVISPNFNADGSTHFSLAMDRCDLYFTDYEATSVRDVALGAAPSRLPVAVTAGKVRVLADVEAVELFAVDGRRVAAAPSAEIDAPEAKGIYIVRAHTAAGTVSAKINIQ